MQESDKQPSVYWAEFIKFAEPIHAKTTNSGPIGAYTNRITGAPLCQLAYSVVYVFRDNHAPIRVNRGAWL